MEGKRAAKVLSFELDFNEFNRRAIARLLGKRRGSLASERECRAWIIETINEKIEEGLMDQ
jgi:hypothetical protein